MAITIAEVTMAAPDVVCLTALDTPVQRNGLLQLASPDPSGHLAYVLRNKTDGSSTPPTIYGRVVGFNADYIHFYDTIPTIAGGDFLDRPSADDVTKYPAIGGLTVTKIRRESKPYDQGYGYNGASYFFAPFRHQIFIYLSGNLPQGGPYSISNSAGAFPTTNFTFNDKTTRALGLRVTQVGHKRADGDKRAFLAQWIPGYGTEGRVDFMNTYGLTEAWVIDANTGWKCFRIPIKLRYKGTWIEPDNLPTIKAAGTDYTVGDVLSPIGGTGPGGGTIVVRSINGGGGVTGITNGSNGQLWTAIGDYDSLPNDPVSMSGGKGSGCQIALNHCLYPSTTVAPLSVTAITKAANGVATYSGSWDPVNGQVLQFRGIGGMTAMEGAIATVANIDTVGKTFQTGINTSGYATYTNGTYLAGYSDLIYATSVGNRANTFVFELDYSAFLAPQFGNYKIWVPGLGVSDTFTIDDAIHLTSAKLFAQGVINQSTGIPLHASYGGWEKPQNLFDGVNGAIIYESLLPGGFSSEATIYASSVTAGYSGQSPYITGTRATNFGKSLHDAGDLDFHAHVHTQMAFDLANDHILLPASRTLQLGTPKASVILDPVIFADVDYLSDLMHLAFLELEGFLVTQKSDGRVYGGMQFNELGNGGGGSTDEPSFLINGTNGTQQPVALAACPAGCYRYASAAVKVAHALTISGETTLAIRYKNSGLAAFNWAESLFQDYIAAGGTAAASFTGHINNSTLTVDSGSLTGTIAVGQRLLGGGLKNCKITSGTGLSWQVSTDWNIGAGTSFTTDVSNTAAGAQFSGYISANSLTVTSMTNGLIALNSMMTASGITPLTHILTQVSGNPGGVGVYTVDNSQTLGSSGSPIAMSASLIDAYFNGLLNFAANANTSSGWSASTYLANINSVFTEGNTLNLRWQALGALYALTSDAQYGDVIAQGFTTPTAAILDFITTPAALSYTNPAAQVAYYLAHNFGTNGVLNQLNSWNAYPFTTDSNYFSPSGTGGMLPLFLYGGIAQNESNPYLKLMHAGGNFWTGANQQGISCTVGLGTRTPDVTLIRDREAMCISTSSVRGTTTYTWAYNNYPQIVFFNLANGNSQLNWTFNCPTAGGLALQGTIEPYYPSMPAMEQYYANSYYIYSAEFTTEQSIVPSLRLSVWRHCWDGNTTTELDSSRKFGWNGV